MIPARRLNMPGSWRRNWTMIRGRGRPATCTTKPFGAGLSAFSAATDWRKTGSLALKPVCSCATRTNRRVRSEEHTSELQSRGHLVCRLLLEKKNNELLHLHFKIITQRYIDVATAVTLELY